MRRLLTIAIAAAVALAAILYLVAEWGRAPAEGAYRLAKADRGEIIATVTATGAINPVTTVIVGSQLFDYDWRCVLILLDIRWIDHGHASDRREP